MLLALLLQVAVPSVEAETLGRRLAAAGGLATMIPMLVETDLTELAGEKPDLTPAERERLFAIGHAEGARGRAKLIDALGHAYAAKLTVADLRVLVRNAEMPETKRLRQTEPAAIVQAMQTLGEMDLKKTVAAQLCKETGKRCER
ncbi:hypothetical protein [Sphingomonas sp. Leaf343]|uniref:hypothetical protein n=1 Tax=Sphingomonas sp. Leaf343 TaxID=1736345 RepID=UPI0006FA1167|nr:hypothetical protein [Sphingomonas sp. Leaf343]KQR83081.1 hypothetical protein ASG07_08870 [Sphingomonas sp. Leaf343]